MTFQFRVIAWEQATLLRVQAGLASYPATLSVAQAISRLNATSDRSRSRLNPREAIAKLSRHGTWDPVLHRRGVSLAMSPAVTRNAASRVVKLAGH